MKSIKSFLVVAALIVPSAAAQTYLPETSTNPLFGELLWHTMAYRQDVAVYPGEFAPRMPLEIKIPDGGRLIGSVVREYGSRTRDVQVVMDSKLTIEQVGSLYRAQIVSPWREVQRRVSGFAFSAVAEPPINSVTLCNPSTGTRVDIYGLPKDDRNWQTSASFVYVNFFEGPRANPSCEDTSWIFPVLLMPRNVSPIGFNGFNMGEFNTDSIAFEAQNADAKKLFEGFASQLPASWKRLSLDERDQEISAVYRYEDSNQSGLAILSVSGFKERPDAFLARLVALPKF